MENFEFTVGSVKTVPDTTDCEHVLDGPTRTEGGLRYGQCPKCGKQVAFRVDASGNRTGNWLIVETKL